MNILKTNKLYWILFSLKGFSHYKIKKFFVKYYLNLKYDINLNDKIFFCNQLIIFFSKQVRLFKKFLKRIIKKYKKNYIKKYQKYLKWKKKNLSIIKHYKWYRYKKNLPLNGQRTKTNSRTNRHLKKIF